MIKVEILGTFSNLKQLTISGHAKSNFQKNQYDLVCAAVSGITFGILNSLAKEDNKIQIFDDKVIIKPLSKNARNLLILEILIKSLENVENDYPNNIRIKYKRN